MGRHAAFCSSVTVYPRPKTLQAMNQVANKVVFVELVEVEIPQFVVADSVGKDVVDSH